MNETLRLETLSSTKILDTTAEERFDRITRLAATTLGTKIALISFVDENRQWFKSKIGLDIDQTPREHAFCNLTIQKPDDVMVILDAKQDPRLRDNPLVIGEPDISFYAGAPLVTKDGYALGTLCVIDSDPRENFDAADRQILKDLAATVMTEIELVNKSQLVSDLSVINEELKHRMGNMYAHISALVSIMGRSEIEKDKLVRRIRDKISTLSDTQALLSVNQFKFIPMSELVASVIAPFRIGENQNRFTFQTDHDFDVSSRGAFILTLMINELGTNAIKHGALSRRGGQIEISWKNGKDLNFKWVERGSTPNGHLDLCEGFGTQILNKIVPMDLMGQASFELLPDGLIYQVSAKPDRVIYNRSSLNLG